MGSTRDLLVVIAVNQPSLHVKIIERNSSFEIGTGMEGRRPRGTFKQVEHFASSSHSI
jgi:hypothetical protein